MNWHEWFTYEPDTGILRWKVNISKKVKTGDIAGTIKDGYVLIGLNGRTYRAHRIIWEMVYGEIPDSYEIDHINHIRYDNRLCNLRLVTRIGNSRNHSINGNNTSSVTGVIWDKAANKWKAQITVNGQNKNLGRYKSLLDAVAARLHAEHEYGFHPNHGN